MLRLMRQPRWLGFAALVVVLATLFVLLGRWQWHRHISRDARNTVLRTNLARDPSPVGQVLRTGTEPTTGQQYATVRASGHYLTGAQLLVRNQVVDGQAGFDVLTPLRTDAGDVLLVVRGWVPAGATATDQPDVPAAPAGEVTVDGWVRPSQKVRDSVDAGLAGQITAVSAPALRPRFAEPVYGGYVELTAQAPASAAGLTAMSAPDLSGGPHVAYAIQWWLFAGISFVGYFVMMRREALDEAELVEDAAGPAPEDAGDPDGGRPRDGAAAGSDPELSAGGDRVASAPLDRTR